MAGKFTFTLEEYQEAARFFGVQFESIEPHRLMVVQHKGPQLTPIPKIGG